MENERYKEITDKLEDLSSFLASTLDILDSMQYRIDHLEEIVLESGYEERMSQTNAEERAELFLERFIKLQDAVGVNEFDPCTMYNIDVLEEEGMYQIIYTDQDVFESIYVVVPSFIFEYAVQDEIDDYVVEILEEMKLEKIKMKMLDLARDEDEAKIMNNLIQDYLKQLSQLGKLGQ